MVIDQLRGGPAFATKEQRQIKSKDIYDIIQEKENKKLIEINTIKSVDNFGGRRFLGLTPKLNIKGDRFNARLSTAIASWLVYNDGWHHWNSSSACWKKG